MYAPTHPWFQHVPQRVPSELVYQIDCWEEDDQYDAAPRYSTTARVVVVVHRESVDAAAAAPATTTTLLTRAVVRRRQPLVRSKPRLS